MPLSSAGRDASSNACVVRPREREIGSSAFAGSIQRSLLTGGSVTATAEHREPCESRGSRTVLGARGGEIPPRDSPYPAPRRKYFSDRNSPIASPPHGATIWFLTAFER